MTEQRSGSSSMAGRRGLLRGAAGLLALGAGGCGFRPLHGDGAPGAEDSAIAEELAATRVAPIPERFGQLLRRSMQQRLAVPAGSAAPAQWEVVVAPNLSAEPLGILRDGAATRLRYIATANWTLLRLAPRETVANGFERALEAFNIQPNQYFAADISREATERRLAEQLAAEVITRVALRFRTLREGAPTRLIEPVTPPPSLPDTPPPGGVLLPGQSGGVGGGLGGGIGPGGSFPP
jgi:LPS-assembly lipoprotein